MSNIEDFDRPSFPPEEVIDQLSSDEIKIIRQMIEDYKAKKTVAFSNDTGEKKEAPLLATKETPVSNLFCDEPEQVGVSLLSSQPSLMMSSELDEKKKVTDSIRLLEKQKLGDPLEADALSKMIEFAKTADDISSEYIAVSILGLIPCKNFIRHGTPEQKLFVLKTLGDRFLDGISGIKWNDRRKLLKVVANYLSALSENYNFIPMEGENYNPTLHERVIGASSGNIIKEMRGFLVVAKGTNRVTYAGVVLT